MLEFGVLPVPRVLLASSSGSQGVLLLFLSVVLPRWEQEPAEEVDARSCFNKLVGPPDFGLGAWCRVEAMEATDRLFFFCHRGDGEGKCWWPSLHRSTRRVAVVFDGVHQLRLGFASLSMVRGTVLGCAARCPTASSTSGPECQEGDHTQEILAGTVHLLATKWFVPSGVEMAGNGVSPAVERTKDSIVF